jgi:hypothetical protein
MESELTNTVKSDMHLGVGLASSPGLSRHRHGVGVRNAEEAPAPNAAEGVNGPARRAEGWLGQGV